MDSLKARLKASLLLTPAFLLLLVWIGRFAGTEDVAKIGFWFFVAWATAVSFVISWCVTMYASYLLGRSDSK